jgi:hypothetical protein
MPSSHVAQRRGTRRTIALLSPENTATAEAAVTQAGLDAISWL